MSITASKESKSRQITIVITSKNGSEVEVSSEFSIDNLASIASSIAGGEECSS